VAQIDFGRQCEQEQIGFKGLEAEALQQSLKRRARGRRSAMKVISERAHVQGERRRPGRLCQSTRYVFTADIEAAERRRRLRPPEVHAMGSRVQQRVRATE